MKLLYKKIMALSLLFSAGFILGSATDTEKEQDRFFKTAMDAAVSELNPTEKIKIDISDKEMFGDVTEQRVCAALKSVKIKRNSLIDFFMTEDFVRLEMRDNDQTQSYVKAALFAFFTSKAQGGRSNSCNASSNEYASKKASSSSSSCEDDCEC